MGLGEPFKGNAATAWGTRQEDAALERYSGITGHAVEACRFRVLRDDDVHGWLGASPDGLIEGLVATPGVGRLYFLICVILCTPGWELPMG